MIDLSPRPCKHCKQMMSSEIVERILLSRGDKISEGMKKAQARGVSVGRERRFDYLKAYELYLRGLSKEKIAKILSCSVSTIRRAVRLRLKEENEKNKKISE